MEKVYRLLGSKSPLFEKKIVELYSKLDLIFFFVLDFISHFSLNLWKHLELVFKDLLFFILLVNVQVHKFFLKICRYVYLSSPVLSVFFLTMSILYCSFWCKFYKPSNFWVFFGFFFGCFLVFFSRI
jgi:hypothetical protein